MKPPATPVTQPERLRAGDDSAALLIQRALAEPAVGPSEAESFRKLESRLQPRSWRWLVPAGSFALAACCALVWFRAERGSLSVSPDTWARAPVEPKAAIKASDSAAPVASPALPVPPKVEARPSSDAEPEIGGCSKLAQASQYQAAAACYGRVARGSSMSAELSLYEKARLEAKALGKSEQALATLGEHTRRFPGGTLSSEVALTRIELLSQLGRRAEALKAIEQALPGALGRERGGDLQVLRANLLLQQGDCAAALTASAAARAAGAHPSRLEAVERRCSDGNGAP